jgi:hypothetical protein
MSLNALQLLIASHSLIPLQLLVASQLLIAYFWYLRGPPK